MNSVSLTTTRQLHPSKHPAVRSIDYGRSPRTAAGSQTLCEEGYDCADHLLRSMLPKEDRKVDKRVGDDAPSSEYVVPWLLYPYIVSKGEQVLSEVVVQ